MRRRGSHTSTDDDVLDVVVLEEERAEDDYLRTLHAIAVAAMALRATSPGDPHPLVEVADPPAPSPDAASDLRRRLRRRGARLGATAVVVALGVVVAATVLEARGDAERLAVLAADPAVLAEVTAPPAELWRADGTPGDVAPARPGVGPAGTEEEHDLLGDGRATWSWAEDGTFDRGLVVVGNQRAYALPGPLLLPAVTDGSFPRTLLSVPASGATVRGIALRTGDRLWSWSRTDGGSLEATVLVDGVVLLDEGDALTALDVRDGTTLWRTALDPDVEGDRTPTDGVVVLLPVPGDDGPQLLAVRIADGTGLWRAPLPPGTTGLAVVERTLVVATDDGTLIGLG